MKRLLLLLCLLLYLSAISSAQVVKSADDNWSVDIPSGWNLDVDNKFGDDVFIYTINDNSIPVTILYNNKYEKTIPKDSTFGTLPEEQLKDMLSKFQQTMENSSQNIKVSKAQMIQLGSNYALYLKMIHEDTNGKKASFSLAQFLHQSTVHSFMLVNTEDEEIYEQQFIEFFNTLEFVNQ